MPIEKLTGVKGGGYYTHCQSTWRYEAKMKSEDVIKKLKRAGWEHVRTKGSHHIFEKEDEPEPIVVPHPTKDVATGTLLRILKQLGEK